MGPSPAAAVMEGYYDVLWRRTKGKLRSRRSCPEGRMEEEDWENHALEICERELGTEKYNKLLDKINKIPPAGLGSKTRLSMENSKLKRAVTSQAPVLQLYNAVGAVGYAGVLPNSVLPATEFFTPGKRFRARLRHSAVRCDDDAASCQRQAALKLADQNEDGPMDLVLTTGRIALARNCKSLNDVINNRKSMEMKNMCRKDPYFHLALVDGFRRAPTSYANLRYHSQLAYRLVGAGDVTVMVRFRLIPADHEPETGLLMLEDQYHPWDAMRDVEERRRRDYLRAEYLGRLEAEPIKYLVQVQARDLPDSADQQPHMWNAQMLWDEVEFPWTDLMEVTLTTPLPPSAIRRTYYNIVNRPLCLQLPPPSSRWDYKSFHNACSTMYTTMELKGLEQARSSPTPVPGPPPAPASAPVAGDELINHVVLLCTGHRKPLRVKADVYITLTGIGGRTTPQRLERRMDGDDDNSEKEIYVIRCENVGYVLTVTLAVRHRHLTDDWFLRYVALSDIERRDMRYFPCHGVVLAKVTLRPGEVRLPNHEVHEVLRQERLLELRYRQLEYMWHTQDSLPSAVRAHLLRDLPVNEQLMADKYTGITWDLEATADEINRSSAQHRRSLTNIFQPFPFDETTEKIAEGGTKTNNPITRATSVKLQNQLLGGNKRLQFKAQNRLLGGNKQLQLKAQAKWRKLRHAINFLAKAAAAKLPEGPKGDMCRACNEDADFGRLFLTGPNPTVIRRCTELPAKFPVTEEDVDGLLDRGLTLHQEMQMGRIYLADYEVLKDATLYQRGGDIRYLTAPMCLLYTKGSGEFVPIAIQVRQQPGRSNPIWTPKDRPDDWLLVKLWVRCADFTCQLVKHVLCCHLAMEPFVVATMRQLSSSHPIFKLLKPHFRYILAGNALMRMHVLSKGGNLDKWTAVGATGFRFLAKKMYRTFHMDDLDLPKDIMARRTENVQKLPNYYYRDDGLKLWKATAKSTLATLNLFYTQDDDVVQDSEIQGWLKDLRENGFPPRRGDPATHFGLPQRFVSIQQVADMVTKVIFTCTCFHSATHCDAIDMYAHAPLVPAMMRIPPPTQRGKGKKEVTIQTLPEQTPDLYYSAMGFLMTHFKAQEAALGSDVEIYFVEEEARAVLEELSADLCNISRTIKARNLGLEHPYEALLPEKIPNCVEPLPFLPDIYKDEDEAPPIERRGMSGSASVPLLRVPLAMQLARDVGGHSFIQRQISFNMITRAMANQDQQSNALPAALNHLHLNSIGAR